MECWLTFIILFLYIMIAEYPLIPEEAFLYFPTPDRIVELRNNIKQRVIFGGGLPFDQQQMQRIEALRLSIGRQEDKAYLNGFPDDFLLRFLQATSFNYQDCIEALQAYHKWQKKMMPLQITELSLKYLRQGAVYFCGRDYHFRPIIVVDIKKILDLKIKESELLYMLGFFFQYIIQNCLIEGQVQTWNTIIDLGSCGVFSLGGTLVQIIKHLSSIFRARSNHSFLVACPSSMRIMWGMVKKVLNEDQIRKITMTDQKELSQQDFVKINKSQVEVKYGGNHPNINNFWPIEIDPYQFKVENMKVRLIEPSEYDVLYSEGKLKNRKIKRSFIAKFKKVEKLPSMKQEEDIMTQKNAKQEDFLFPQQKQPQIPVYVDSTFTYFDLF